MSENQEIINTEVNNVEDNPKKSGKAIKILLLGLLVLAFSAASVTYYYYDKIYGNHLNPFPEDIIVKIPTGSDLTDIVKILKEKKIIANSNTMLWVAKLMKYNGKSGMYQIPKKTKSYHDLISILRSGQTALNVTFNNIRLKEQFAGHIAKYIEADSLSILSAMLSTDFLDKEGFNSENLLCMYIPNTYQFFWDTDADKFVLRMLSEYKIFWNKTRLEKAKKQNLSPIQVYILASIIDAETNFNPEKRRVAGVYLNRLRTKGWKLEADPTIVFAAGDFTVKRVTNEMLKINSPYNTYLNEGLPPGPIRMASVSSIDAVLDAEEHDFWFFCAKPPVDGEPAQHAFAKTLGQHNVNARKYRYWLNSQKIYR